MKIKKIILLPTIIIICMCFLAGCDLANTPTSQVEEYLSKYQRLDKTIDINEFLLIDEENLTENKKEEYQKLIKKQYRNLSYSIKGEEIDGNKAKVTAEITVLDYGREIRKLEEEKDLDYSKKLLENLKKVKKKVTYTIKFKVEQDENNQWKVEPLGKDDQEKLLGIYS